MDHFGRPYKRLPGFGDIDPTSIVGLAISTGNSPCKLQTAENGLLDIVMGALSALTGLPLALADPLFSKWFACAAGRNAVVGATLSCLAGKTEPTLDQFITKYWCDPGPSGLQQNAQMTSSGACVTAIQPANLAITRNAILTRMVQLYTGGMALDQALATALYTSGPNIIPYQTLIQNYYGSDTASYAAVIGKGVMFNNSAPHGGVLPNGDYSDSLGWYLYGCIEASGTPLGLIVTLVGADQATIYPTSTIGLGSLEDLYAGAAPPNSAPVAGGSMDFSGNPQAVSASVGFCTDLQYQLTQANQGKFMVSNSAGIDPNNPPDPTTLTGAQARIPFMQFTNNPFSVIKAQAEFQAVYAAVNSCFTSAVGQVVQAVNPAAYGQYMAPGVASPVSPWILAAVAIAATGGFLYFQGRK